MQIRHPFQKATPVPVPAQSEVLLDRARNIMDRTAAREIRMLLRNPGAYTPSVCDATVALHYVLIATMQEVVTFGKRPLPDIAVVHLLMKAGADPYTAFKPGPSEFMYPPFLTATYLADCTVGNDNVLAYLGAILQHNPNKKWLSRYLAKAKLINRSTYHVIHDALFDLRSRERSGTLLARRGPHHV